MRVVYHIGWHKTGSTFLQEFFARNAEKLLRDHSILYPTSGRRGTAHHRLFVRTTGGNRVFRTVSNEWPDLTRELEACADSTRSALISTESMQALTPEAIEALTEWPSMDTVSAEGIVYLRRHDAFMESQFAERIKFGTHLPWRETYSRMLERDALYTGHLGRFRSSGKLKRLILRPFAPGRWKNQNLVDDFFEHAFGLKLDGGLEMPGQRNPSPDPRTLHILDRFHRAWKGEPLPPRIIKVGIVAPLGEALRRVGLTPQKPVFLRPEERLVLLENFAPESEMLKEWSGGAVDFAAETVSPKASNLDLFEHPSPDEIRGIMEHYLQPDFYHSGWESLPPSRRHFSQPVRAAFGNLLGSDRFS